MKERIFLCLLWLSGWKGSACLSRQYHYVTTPMTWTEAQTYCRETYTDLATLENREDSEQVVHLVSHLNYDALFWIGAYSKIEWKWSDGYNGSGADYRNWGNFKEPDFTSGLQFCVMIESYGGMWDYYCSFGYPFICNSGTEDDPSYVLVNETKSWTDAQWHCRENFKDLATITSEAENEKAKSLLGDEEFAWIGMYRDDNIHWSDEGTSTYTNWYDSSNRVGFGSVVCAAVDLWVSNDGEWRPQPCEERHPFVCYSAPHKKLLKLKIKVQDSVDLNDVAVKAEILRKLQEKLNDNGLSDARLKWTKPTVGQVFCRQKNDDRSKKDCN